LLNSALVNAITINGWNLLNPTAVGGSILYDATKGPLKSSVLITPNASQVAKVLRGGVAGIALSFAVEQLLGAVDWVLDPANSRIRYKEKSDPDLAAYGYYIPIDSNTILYGLTKESICTKFLDYYSNKHPLDPNDTQKNSYRFEVIDAACYIQAMPLNVRATYSPIYNNLNYDQNKEKNLSLITIAQQVIENAESDNLDAQFAVLAAATNILSEAEQDDAKAKPIADELERNSNDKCKDHNFKMDSQAATVEWRYNELIADRYNLYINNRSVSNPLILNGINKGSWDGHVSQYKYAQGVLRNFINKAANDGCLATPRANEWVNVEPPSQPGSSS
ncbi:MAG: hypothetical protein L0G61_05500, partial [Staphylococcus equorum]|nr:hypothetical protein [Staphylococcus equorum]